ncbi:MAG: PAS domain S-box protein [Peptococcaceae bacterium]
MLWRKHIEKNGKLNLFLGVGRMDKAGERAELFNNLVNSLNDSVYLCTIDEDGCPGRFIDVNDYGCRLLGYSRDELLQMGLADVLSRAGIKMRNSPEVAARFTGGRHYVAFESHQLTKSGNLLPMEYNCYIFKLKAEKVCLVIARGIAEHKKTENVLVESELKYRDLLELSPDGICIHKDGKIIFINELGAKILGFTNSEEMLGHEVLKFVHPDYRQMAAARIREIFTENKSAPFVEEKVITRNGEALDVEIAAAPFKLNGEAAVLTVIRNITEKKRSAKAIRESEEKYRFLFENAPMGVIHYDINGKIMTCNDLLVRMIGRNKAELVGKNVFDFADKELVAVIKQVLSKGKQARYAGWYNSKNFRGALFLQGEFGPIIDDGEISGGVGVIQDLTEQKRVMEELTANEMKYRCLFNNLRDMLFVFAIDNGLPGRFLEINEKACEMLGYSRAEFMTMNFNDIDPHGDTGSFSVELLDKIITTGEVIFESVFITKYGCVIPIEINAHIIEYDEQSVVLAIARDITNRKKTENELRQSENKYRELFNNLNDLVFVISLNKKTGEPERIIEANKIACARLGFDKEELLSLNPADINSAKRMSSENHRYLEKLKKGERVIFETELVSKKNQYIPVEIHGYVIDYNGERVCLAIAQDISERRKAEIDLRESEKRYRDLVEFLPDAVIVHDFKGRVLFANSAALKLVNAEDYFQVSGMTAFDFLQDDYKMTVLERMYLIRILGKVLPEQRKIIDTNGKEKYIEVSGVVINFQNTEAVMIIIRDITDKKQAEAVIEETRRILFEKEKLALIGQMSAGLAHEIRNPLTAVRGFSQLLKLRQHDQEKVAGFVDTIMEEIDRVNDLISDFLQLSRPKEPVLKRQSVSKVINESLEILKPQALLCNIDVEFISDADPAECLFDKDQIKQVFLNLCKNSLDAMPQGGKITIVVGKTKAGNEIFFSVEDTGCGIPENKISKLGEPFFSSKEKGTGLGLSISYSIIRAHKGRIEVSSKEDSGTKFTIYLPIN